MKISSQLTETTLLKELGQRITAIRLNKNLSQHTMSEEAGISKSTLERLESGHSIQLSGFLRVLKALNMAETLEIIFPEATISPMAQLQFQKKKRQRASRNINLVKINESPKPWTWRTEV